MLGEGAKLILASDWSYSPYTYIYPDLFPGQQFVIVSLPYSEAGHVLGLPLAGHELGHNVWAADGLANEFTHQIAITINELLNGDFRDLYDEYQSGKAATQHAADDLFASGEPWLDSLRYSIKQCEELFCDFFGIAIFGESYLSSFEYLTAPWSFERVPEYPSMAERIAAQAQCAKSLGLRIPEYYDRSGLTAHVEADVILQIADVATRRQIAKLIDSAKSIISQRLPSHQTINETDRIAACFKVGRPATSTLTVSDVLNAAWQCVNLEESGIDNLSLINELTLKTLEVQEIETIQREATACSTQQKLLN